MNENTEIIAAFTEAWAKIGTIGFDATNPGFKRGGQAAGYASLQHITETVRPILAEHGLAMVAINTPSDTGVCVTTRLLHKSGQWMDLGSMSVPADKNSAQAFGSALTYARRYCLLSSLGLVTDEPDDDGKAASLAPEQSETIMSIKLRITAKIREEWGFADSDIKDIVLKAVKHTGAANTLDGWRAVEKFLAQHNADTIMDFLNGGGSAADALNGAAAKVAGGSK